MIVPCTHRLARRRRPQRLTCLAASSQALLPARPPSSLARCPLDHPVPAPTRPRQPSDRFFHNIGSPRALIVADFESKLFIPYDRILAGRRGSPAGPARHVRGAATSVDAARKTVSVRLATGEEISIAYDILVIALGSHFSAPAKPASVSSGTAMAALASVRAAVAAAGVVAIIGGGPTGIETAGEIATGMPGKEVHLVQRPEALLSGLGLKTMPAQAAAALAKLGVKVHLGTSATLPSPLPEGVMAIGEGMLLGKLPLTLSDGTTLHPDVTLLCLGRKPNAEALRASPSLGASIDGGHLLVAPSMHVRGQAHVFAAGDIAATDENKLAYASAAHATVVAKNVAKLAAAMASGTPTESLAWATYTPQPTKRSTVLTVGRNVGLAQINGGALPGWIIRMVKGPDLLTAKTTGELGWTAREAGIFPGAPAPAMAAAAAGGVTAG